MGECFFVVGRKVADKTGAGQTSNYTGWQFLHFMWEDVGYEHVQNHQVRCYWFIYEPENIIHSLKVSKCILIGYQIICQRYTYTTCGNCRTAFEFLWMWIWNLPLLVNINVKCSCYRPGVAQRVGRGIALLFHDRGTRRWVSGKQYALAALYPRERPGTHFTGGWVSPRAGLDGRKISSLPGFDPGPSSP